MQILMNPQRFHHFFHSLPIFLNLVLRPLASTTFSLFLTFSSFPVFYLFLRVFERSTAAMFFLYCAKCLWIVAISMFGKISALVSCFIFCLFPAYRPPTNYQLYFVFPVRSVNLFSAQWNSLKQCYCTPQIEKNYNTRKRQPPSGLAFSFR